MASYTIHTHATCSCSTIHWYGNPNMCNFRAFISALHISVYTYTHSSKQGSELFSFCYCTNWTVFSTSLLQLLTLWPGPFNCLQSTERSCVRMHEYQCFHCPQQSLKILQCLSKSFLLHSQDQFAIRDKEAFPLISIGSSLFSSQVTLTSSSNHKIPSLSSYSSNRRVQDVSRNMLLSLAYSTTVTKFT